MITPAPAGGDDLGEGLEGVGHADQVDGHDPLGRGLHGGQAGGVGDGADRPQRRCRRREVGDGRRIGHVDPGGGHVVTVASSAEAAASSRSSSKSARSTGRSLPTSRAIASPMPPTPITTNTSSTGPRVISISHGKSLVLGGT